MKLLYSQLTEFSKGILFPVVLSCCPFANKKLISEFVVFYLDDGTLGGKVEEENNWKVIFTICPRRSDSTAENNYEENTK